jgi:hypothetical protein
LPTAFLTIHSEPSGARVFIDGRHTGERTSVRDLPLDPGEHAVELSVEGYRPWRRTIDAERGQMLRIRAMLRSASPEEGDDAGAGEAGRPVDYGLLSVDTRPPSKVFHGGRELGSTPLAGVELPAGTYTLVFRVDDGQRFERAVNIRSGRTTRRQFDFTPDDTGESAGDEPEGANLEPGAADEQSPQPKSGRGKELTEGSSLVVDMTSQDSAPNASSQGYGTDR